MLPTLALVLAQGYTGPGTIPRLGPRDLVVVTEGGGQLGYEGRLVVRLDGTAELTSKRRDRKASTRRWRLSRPDLRRLTALIESTDFDALHREPRAPTPPSAFDGIDRGLIVRKGKVGRGWSNTIWNAPAEPVPLFEALSDRMTRS